MNIPPNYKSYFEIDFNHIERVQIFLNSKYVFTVGLYKREMGFYIDFPNFNQSTTSVSDYVMPKGLKYLDKINPRKTEFKTICPKLSFHESGLVLLSKGGIFFDKEISRQQTRNSIFENDGGHVFTISLQNLKRLKDEPYSTKNRVQHTTLPFQPIPEAIKFVGNLWREKDLRENFKDFSTLRNGTEMPIVWPRKDGSNLGDIVFILKFCHLNKVQPLYLTVRCMPISVLDKDYKTGTLLTLISGLIFDEINDLSKDTKFISFTAKNEII